MKKWLGLLLLLTAIAQAGLPPTTSKLSTDTNNVTTFFYDFPNFTGTHSGVTVSLGVDSVAGGGTGLANLGSNCVVVGESTANVHLVCPVASGDVLTDNGPGVDPSFKANPGTGAITQLTGAVMAIGPGSTTATLSNTGVTAGTYLSPLLTVGADGRITSISSNGITWYAESPVTGVSNGSNVTFTTSHTPVSQSALIVSIDGLQVASNNAVYGWSLSGTTVTFNTAPAEGQLVYFVYPVGTTAASIVSSVTATTPILSSGGSTPNISIIQAGATTSGYLSSTDWNTFNSKAASGNYITQLTGDGSAIGPGNTTLTLSTVNSNVGSFGSASMSPTFTVNGKGLITAASQSSIAAPASGITGVVNVINGGTGATTSTGSGSVVLSNSPSLISPSLDTPTSLTLTNATGLGLTTGVTGILPVANGGTNGSTVSGARTNLGIEVGATTLTSGTTYTTPSTITTSTTFKFTLIGGGGGGGGCTAARGSSAGGGAGGFGSVWLTGLSPSTGYTIAIGAGGSTASGAAGGNGGNTTLTVGATTYTAFGGTGGTIGPFANGAAGVSGGGTSNLTFAVTGQSSNSVPSSTAGFPANSGGSSPMGPGGQAAWFPATGGTSGAAATGYGGGGGGAGNSGTSPVALTGGAATQGAIIVEYWN
jgi:hypothetical protein